MKLNSQSTQCWKMKLKKNSIKETQKTLESTEQIHHSGHETEITS
jgi:hypothetical protein